MVYLLLSVAAIWMLFSATALRNLLAAPPLPKREALPPGDDRQAVSVIIAARDEAQRIEQTVRGLLAQREIELELVVVDDRSRDETPAILSKLSAEDARLRVVRIDELPAGWLGKCHACARGAEQARGEWLLFTDGDIHMRDDVIARAVATARREAADHLTLWPAVNTIGPLARGAILAWGQCLAVFCPASQINRDRGTRGVGVGAFNLIRAETYRVIGGHEPLRMEVVDDVKLGWLVRRGGFRQRLYRGFDEIEAEWAQSAAGVVRAVEKNWFAGMNYNLWHVTVILAVMSGIWLLGLLGPLLHPAAGWMAFAGWLSPVVPALWQTRQTRWPVWTALLTPLGFALFVVAGVNSTWKTLRQGGVRWRDTLYPLSELRKGAVR